MTTNYPLVEERVLPPVVPSGRLLRRRRRDITELPLPRAHQILVFRLGDQYIADSVRRPGDDPLVCDATSVTVVDTAVDVAVTVETEVPSAETESFILKVTFACTVTDPVAVVRAGLDDLPGVLLARVRALPGLTEISGGYPLTESSRLSRALTARLTAYAEMEGAGLHGVSLGSVSAVVLSPEAVAELQRTHDDERRRIEAEEQAQRYKLQNVRLQAEIRESEEELQRITQEQQYLTRTQQRRYGYEETKEDQAHELNLAAGKASFERDQAVAEYRTVDSDPLIADQLARSRGEISTDEAAGRLRADSAAHRERRQALEDRRHDEERIQAQLEREDAREERQHRKELEERQRQEGRDDKLAERTYHQAVRDRQLEYNHTILGKAIDAGLFSDQHVEVESLMSPVPHASSDPAPARGADPAVDPADTPASIEPAHRGHVVPPDGGSPQDTAGRRGAPPGDGSAQRLVDADGPGSVEGPWDADGLGDAGEEERAR
ncbi:hypothetical protein [Streptomyces sp. NPDC048425]|uniref:hypothetical protein n=1 Tax=Streptomyces sp. NPDC048425 TaxID=3365548 RepID=UPI003715985A